MMHDKAVSAGAVRCSPCWSLALAVPSHRLLRRGLRTAACTPSSAARWRSSRRSRRAPTARSSRSATCSAGSATRSTPRSSATSSCEAERDQLRNEVATAHRREPRPRAAQGPEGAERPGGLGELRPGRGARVSPARRAPGTRRLPDQQGLERRRHASTSRSSTAPASSARSSRSPTATPSVMLLTDQDFGVSAQALESGEPGSVGPRSALPATCSSTSCRTPSKVRKGELIFTAGTSTSSRVSACASLYPRGDPDRHGQADRDRRGRARPADPRPAGRRPAPPRHRAGADRAARRPAGAGAVTITPQAAVPPRPARAARRHRRSSAPSRRSSIFGVPADLSPLLVASVGFLCGLDPRRRLRLLPRPVRRHLAAADARRDLARLHGGRLRRRPHPRAARPRARPRAGRRSAPRPPRSRRSASRCCSSCSASRRRCRCCSLRQILMTIVLNTLLALPVYAICRRVLLPFLPEDPRRRRRRAYTTGGLSPLSRA